MKIARIISGLQLAIFLCCRLANILCCRLDLILGLRNIVLAGASVRPTIARSLLVKSWCAPLLDIRRTAESMRLFREMADLLAFRPFPLQE